MRALRVLLAGLAVSGSALGGCAPDPTPSPVSQQAPAATEYLPIEAMTPAAKRAAIATGFPAEVPVPVGDFTRGRAQGDDAWDYVVEVPAPAEEVVAWYRDAYIGRQWVLTREDSFDAEQGGGMFLEFRKAAAQSSVRVSVGQSGGPARAAVTVGVGAPVLDTQ